MPQFTIKSQKRFKVLEDFDNSVKTQTFDIPDETTQAMVQNPLSTESDKYVSVRRFWQGIIYFLSVSWTFLAKITFQVAPRFNSTTASLPLKVNATKDLVSGQIVTTDIANNATTNAKLAQSTQNSIKSNPTNATNDVQDLQITANAFVGRVDGLNSGNLTSVPVAKLMKGKVTMVAGEKIIFDTRITSNSVATCTPTNVGILSTVPIRADTSIAGQCKFYNGQVGDNAEINYQIIF